LASGKTLAQVAQGILESQEGQEWLLGGWYAQYLNRSLDEQGRVYWSILMVRNYPDDFVLATLLAQNEYYWNATI